ncbi:MAG: glycosyltransferase [Bacillota bacterium]|nr:glycosyltransferase [Bacillota bacterium]
MNVLLLTVATGGGHQKAAEAVKEIAEKCFPGSKTLLIDALRYSSPVADRIIVGSYLNTIRNTPFMYRRLYQMSERGESFYGLSNTVNRFLSHRLEKLIKDFNPSVIVTTHPLALQMICGLKGRTKLDIPIVAVITDMAFHSFWMHDGIDAYIISHEFLKKEMINWGIPEQKIFVYGIPVSQKFLVKRDRKEVLQELGLEDKLTALVMGGSLGIGEIYGVFESLVKCSRDIQVIVVTGQNKKLRKKLEKSSRNNGKMVKILGFTDKIPDLMDASDFILTKPGGLTVTEALHKEIPLFVISPIPGAEEVNASFLINNGAAVSVIRSTHIESVMQQVIDNPAKINHMKEMARNLSNKDSWNNTAQLLSRIEKRDRDRYEEINCTIPVCELRENISPNLLSSIKRKLWLKI